MGIMDTVWLKARRKELHITDHDIGAAINRERSTGSRIITGDRQIKWVEIDVMAKVFDVSRLEMLRRAGFEVDEAKRSHAKRDAINLIDGMDDDEVRLLIPLLDKAAELVRKTGS